MKRHRPLIPFAALALAIAACGGGGPTQAPGAATTNPGNGGTATDVPQATDAPVATQSGGGGGGGGQYGSIKFRITGAVEKTGELPFVPAGSMFGGTAGTVLNFADTADNTQIVSVLVNESGEVVVSYSGTDGQVPAAECTTSDWKLEAKNASGKFDCTAAVSMTGSGAMIEGGTITGEFTAHT